MVYQALTADYGFMVPGRAGLHFDFPLSTIQDSTPSDTNVYTESAMVTVAKVPLGRHSELFGARSWVFSATIREPGCVATACFLKFVWSPKKMSEIDAHKGIIDMGAPYVPELLYSATIRVSANAKDIEGAVLAVDMAGQPINACFASVANSSAWHIVDIFAGYVHTLLAASTASDRCMILHRDVSTGNLLVGPRYKPCLIDWGMGVVLARSNDAHIPSPEALVGTAIYMSVRVLKGCGRRSVIDDLESMFLVYSRCLWDTYGRGKSLGALWSSQEELDTVLITRMYWLTSERVYIAEMDLSECPHALEVLAREFYRLLFPAAIDMANIVRSRHDPRLRDFNADGWVSAFKRALCAEQTHSTVVATCVDKLVEYFDKLDCPIAGTIAPPGSSPQLHDLAAHLTIQQPSLHSTDLGAAWDEAERPYTPTHAPKEAHARQRDNMNRRPDDAEDPDSPDNMSRLRRLRHRASRGTYNFFKNASPKHRKK
ncbi:hypothetical protein GGF46_003490 [Coemansia sp. RSA 552]|nr:hypothetical protein GGF46_003490 [Coemansia sp. RSA 552]